MRAAVMILTLMSFSCVASKPVRDEATRRWENCWDFEPELPEPSAPQSAQVAAATAYEKGCRDGNACACKKLGGLIGYEKKDRPLAMPWFVRSCELGDQEACNSAGVIFFNAIDVPRDQAKAVSLWKRGCDMAIKWGEPCWNLAKAYRDGVGAPQDSQLAIQAANKACSLQHAESCSWLASRAALTDAGADQ